MQPIARQITVTPCTMRWCTAEAPPPPRPHLPLSEWVTLLADFHGRLITTVAIYSHLSRQWYPLFNATPLYWQQKERP